MTEDAQALRSLAAALRREQRMTEADNAIVQAAALGPR